jgi:hypothetical protein
MSGKIIAAAPHPSARIIGVVYLLYFLVAILAVVLVRGIVVPGDSAATANNIVAHKPLFQSGFAIGLVGTALYVAMTALFYGLFKPVNKTLALLAAFVSLVGCAIQAAGSLFQIAPAVVLGGDHYLSIYSAPQLQALSLLFLNLNARAGSISIIFFGFFDFAIGCLVYKSTFLPRALGVLMALAGLGWLTFLWPALAGHLSPFVDVLGFVAEAALMIWLLVRGVDLQRWSELAG